MHDQHIRIDLNLSGCVCIDGMAELTKSINNLGSIIVALSQDLKDLTKKIDDATNKIAARIDTLMGKITNAMTDAEVNEVKAGLQSEIDKLTSLGADPTNPVPNP